MPKYYCDYCKSYLTHDTISVRKSHLTGKNHIRYYCNYYEGKAKEAGIWDNQESPYEIGINVLNTGAPGFSKTENSELQDDQLLLPPPPNLQGFPNPPPSVFSFTEEYQAAIAKHTRPNVTL